MAGRKDSTAAAAVAAVVLCVVATSCSWVSEASILNDEDKAPRTVPLYIHKARLYLQRQKAYERTMQARMNTLSRAVDSFSTALYLQHVKHNDHGNALLSPLTAYVSLAMALTAARGHTKSEILTAMALSGEGQRGIHTSVQRALQSLLDDDTDDVNSDLSAERDLSGEMQSDEPAVDLSYKDLENIIRNDYLMDSSISYNTGQTHIKYSTAVKTGSAGVVNDSPLVDQRESNLFIRTANGMFHSEEVALSQHFSNRLVSLYGAPPMAMQQDQPETSVNLWVDAVTRGVIPDMLTSDNVNNETLLVLVNALSFWGSWENNFDEKEIIPLKFKTQDGDSVTAQSMYRTGNYSVKIVREMGVQVLELPYSNKRYSLFILLPRPSTGVHGLEEGLKKHKIRFILQDMPEPTMTIVLLPKFHLRSRLSLGSELKRHGVHRLFKKRKADLRRMTDEDKRWLYVNDLFQYAALEVNDGAKSDAGKNSVTIGSGWDTSSSSNILDTISNSSTPIHISDTDNVDDELDSGGELVDDNVDEELENENESDDYDYEYEYYEDYDYEQESFGESANYFIADKPFFFVVKDKQYDLILLMGRVTNPLP